MKRWEKVFSLLVIVIFFVSCQSHKQKKASRPEFASVLQKILQPADTTGKKVFGTISNDVRYTYQCCDYQAIWVSEQYKPNSAAGKIIEELEDTYWDGLDTVRYHLWALKKLKIKLDTTKNNSINDAIAFDTALTRCYLLAAKELLIGRVLPKKADSLWYCVNDSLWSAPQFLADSSRRYHSLNEFRSAVPTYALLRDEYKHFYTLAGDSVLSKLIAGIHAVKHPDSETLNNAHNIIRTVLPWVQTVPNDSVSEEIQFIAAYQAYAGLRQTGKLDSNTLNKMKTPIDTFLQKISANMERIRWMQREVSNLYLIVDVPLMELFLRKDGVNQIHMRVVVGKQERQTPSLTAKMANVIINPSWGVPPTILKNDVLPGLQKSGRKYLNKKGLKAYDSDGDVVDPAFINAHNYKRFTYKQAPGDDNSLGYVKFNLPNHWDIYLHDTPHRDDFGKRDRFLSSGCIRVQRPKEMAIYILSELEKRRFTVGKLDSMIMTHKTKYELLKNKIPVYIAYLTAFEDTTGKHIQFTRDIYHRDGKLIGLLN